MSQIDSDNGSEEGKKRLIVSSQNILDNPWHWHDTETCHVCSTGMTAGEGERGKGTVEPS